MFSSLLIWLQSIAFAYGAWGVFFLAFLQEVVPPIPSTLVTVASGGLLLTGSTITLESIGRLVSVVGIPIAAGMTAGSIIVYGVVYWGGAPLVKRFGHLIGISWGDIEQLQERLQGTAADEVIFFAARAFPLTPSILLNVVCGLVRWNPVSFVFSTFFGTIIRATWTGFIGWQLGSAIVTYERVIRFGNWIVVGLAAAAVVGFVVYRRRKTAEERAKVTP